MNINLYVWILAGIGIAGYLLYPTQATFLSVLASGELEIDAMLQLIVEALTSTSGAIIGAGVVAIIGIIGTQLGSSTILPILWRVSVFFLIPNLFLLPTNLIIASGLPVLLQGFILAFFNILLILVAVEYWR